MGEDFLFWWAVHQMHHGWGEADGEEDLSPFISVGDTVEAIWQYRFGGIGDDFSSEDEGF